MVGRHIWMIVLLLLIFGCNSISNKKGLTSTELADIICICSAPLEKYNEELQELMVAKEMDILANRIAEGDTKMTSTINCITDQLDGTVEHLINAELNANVRTSCQREKRMLQDIITSLSEFKMPQ